MTLLEKLKSILGLDDASSSEDDRDVGVTVERDGQPSGPGTAADGTDENAAGNDGGTAGESAGTGSASTTGGNGTESAESPEETGVVEEAEPEDEAGAGEEAATDDDEDDDRVPSEAVDVIKGIGPTYADRLANAGVETVDDLAAADADEVADSADVPKGRLDDWIERAKARSR